MSIFGWDFPAGAANDPYAPYNQTDWPEDVTPIIEALRQHCTGRWVWEKIHCCLTGKNSDLDASGQQGIEVLKIKNDNVICVAHIGFTVPGTDVSLNVADDISDQEYDKKLDSYMDAAGEIVVDYGLFGCEYTGDDWYQSEEIEFSVPLMLNEKTDEIDLRKTVQTIIQKAEEVLAGPVLRVAELDKQLNELAGWA